MFDSLTVYNQQDTDRKDEKLNSEKSTVKKLKKNVRIVQAINTLHRKSKLNIEARQNDINFNKPSEQEIKSN